MHAFTQPIVNSNLLRMGARVRVLGLVCSVLTYNCIPHCILATHSPGITCTPFKVCPPSSGDGYYLVNESILLNYDFRLQPQSLLVLSDVTIEANRQIIIWVYIVVVTVILTVTLKVKGVSRNRFQDETVIIGTVPYLVGKQS